MELINIGEKEAKKAFCWEEVYVHIHDGKIARKKDVAALVANRTKQNAEWVGCLRNFNEAAFQSVTFLSSLTTIESHFPPIGTFDLYCNCAVSITMHVTHVYNFPRQKGVRVTHLQNLIRALALDIHLKYTHTKSCNSRQ